MIKHSNNFFGNASEPYAQLLNESGSELKFHNSSTDWVEFYDLDLTGEKSFRECYVFEQDMTIYADDSGKIMKWVTDF